MRNHDSTDSNAVLEAQDVGCVRGERKLFSDLNFDLRAGQLLRVAGENGSGKTSLLRILCGLREPTEGAVRWNGRPIGSSREDYQRSLAYVGHLNGIKDELSPLENLEIAARLAGRPATRGAMLAALDLFGVAACADLPVRILSQGQRRRVALSRLVHAATVPLWILDEPFNALDAAAVARLERLIAGHVGAGGIVVLTTHLEVALAAVEVLLLDLGRRADRA
jgi:heme exporter protein A